MGIVILLTLITIKPSRMLRLFGKSLGNPTHKLINDYILTQYIVFVKRFCSICAILIQEAQPHQGYLNPERALKHSLFPLYHQ